MNTKGMMFSNGESADDYQDIISEIENDRSHTGREIHDVLGHDLAVLLLKTRRYRDMCEGSHPAQARLFQTLEEDLNSIMITVRQILNGLVPIDLGDESFAQRLRDYVASISANTGLGCRLECEGDLLVVNIDVRTQLLRIIQEAVHNALVHSCCSEIVISVHARNAWLDISVKDNGVGFDHVRNAQGNGHGQKIMSYRALSIGASLDVTSSPGEGTSVQCRIPASQLQPRTH